MTAPALDPQQVMVGTANGPGLWIAPEGTAPPALGEAYAAPWVSLGYASDDGPTLSGNISSESITPWQSRSPIRVVITGRELTMQFVLWQLNQATLGLYFDSTVPAPDAEGNMAFDVRDDGGGLVHAISIDGADGGSGLRITFGRATLSDAGDMQLQKGAAVPLDVTLTALDNAGVLAHVDITNVGLVA